jgi:adenylate cyclase
MGDGLLAEFGSAVDAVECAAAIQRAMPGTNPEAPDGHRIELRIGVHVGDVIVEGEDRHGEAVNIAARLQQIAEPSGICVSRRVMELARKKVAVGFDLIGEERLKNIADPVAVYSIRLDGASSRQAPTLPEKPSIAVLPFANMSEDPKQEYFADGVVEEIITALSRFRQLFVIARNSSFTYKGSTVHVKQVGRELGVRYVLEGSVRRAGNRVRIAGQLIDAATSAHLWADRFDGGLEDIFDLQDQVTASVVGAIVPKLEEAEIERAKRKPTDSLDAYDYYLRGLAGINYLTREANDEALHLFKKAIDLDPGFALAYARAAHCFLYRKTNGWMMDRVTEIAEATRLAQRAVELGRDDAVALSFGGQVLAAVVGELDDGAAFVDRALSLNGNLANGWGVSGWMKICFGHPDVAIEHEVRAMRLSPLDPRLFAWQFHIAYAYLFTGRYDEAASWAVRSLRNQPNHLAPMRILAASNALAGRLDEAQKVMTRLRSLDPALRISNLEDVLPPFRRAEDRARLVEGLRKAGLPE